MENLVNEVFEIVKDYRADEGLSNVLMTKERISTWVEQFETQDREFILTELKSILKKRYCSKDGVKLFLRSIIKKLADDFKYTDYKQFLNNTVFLDLQPEGKSQKIMLAQLYEVLKDDYGYIVAEGQASEVKHFIYLDDILCTGNTLIQDIVAWCDADYSEGVKNVELISQGKASLTLVFIFIHEKNYYKKKAEMKHKISKVVADSHKIYRVLEVKNSLNNEASVLDFVFPVEENQPNDVAEYKDRIIGEVDEYTKRYKSVSDEEFYRISSKPQVEKLFSSPENRIKFENILLKKGIEILNIANVRVNNMRALGYSLPSQKDFGFGTLCFTWRNIANNTPLVFWYSGGGFYPLFVKNHTN